MGGKSLVPGNGAEGFRINYLPKNFIFSDSTPAPMFFYFSQFLSFLAMPLTLVLLLLLIAAIFTPKSRGKKILWTGILLLVFFSNPFLSNLALLAWEPPYKSFEEIPNREIGIVLTGVTNLNKTTTDRTFFGKGADRITQALQLYRMGKIKKILITGGQGLNPTNTYSEAELLKRFLMMTGMPEADILIEEKSVNTRENALFTKEFLEKSIYKKDGTPRSLWKNINDVPVYFNNLNKSLHDYIVVSQKKNDGW